MYSQILEPIIKADKLNNDFTDLIFEKDIYCISLSGGVDSMVLMDILHKRDKKIIAIHINYNNRDESIIEENFLKQYCEERQITFICHSFDIKRGFINRNYYENYTKQIKFQIYEKIIKDFNLDCILLAHHKDDVIENIFTNFCRGNNFLNLSVIKQSNIIMNVNIVRPLINYYKKDIYNYAHYYEIPYFLDTTPEWSVRGKFRNTIKFYLLDTFAGFKNNLLKIANESAEWGTLIQTKIIDKYIDTIVYNVIKEEKIIEMLLIVNDEDYSKYPLCFWSEIITKIFHKYNKNAPSRKSLELFMKAISNNQEKKILLKNEICIIIKKDRIIIKI